MEDQTILAQPGVPTLWRQSQQLRHDPAESLGLGLRMRQPQPKPSTPVFPGNPGLPQPTVFAPAGVHTAPEACLRTLGFSGQRTVTHIIWLPQAASQAQPQAPLDCPRLR